MLCSNSQKNDISFDVWWRFFFSFQFLFYTCELHFIPLRLPLSKNMLVKVKCVVLTVRSKGANAQSSVLLNVSVAWRLLRINNSEPGVLCLLFTTFLSSTWPCLSILCVLSKIENVQELESRRDQQILVRWNPDNICMLICIIANTKVYSQRGHFPAFMYYSSVIDRLPCDSWDRLHQMNGWMDVWMDYTIVIPLEF